nr:MAG TPA: hypothetical protein [Caudoviricetes sp.]
MPADARAQATAQGARRTYKTGYGPAKHLNTPSSLPLMNVAIQRMRGWSPRITSRCEQSPARIPFCGLAATPAHNGTARMC